MAFVVRLNVDSSGSAGSDGSVARSSGLGGDSDWSAVLGDQNWDSSSVHSDNIKQNSEVIDAGTSVVESGGVVP